MSTSSVPSSETVNFYCHTCSARFSLPAPSSPFHFTLCPRCRQDYLDDSPTPHQAPQPVLPPPPPPCAVPWPSRSAPSSIPLPPPPFSSSSSSSSTTLTLRSSTTAEATSTPQDLLPPPLPPWLLQASASQDPWNYFFSPSDCPPRPPPIPCISLAPSSSSSTSTLPRTLVSACTRPSSSSTSTLLPASSHEPCDYFFGPSDPVRSSPAVSALSSAYSSACSSPRLASPTLHRQRQGELQPESSPLAPSSSTTSWDPCPPPPPPWDSPLHGAWDDEYIFSPPGSDFESPLRPLPSPPPPPASAYDTTFDTPLQRRGSPAAPPTVFAYDVTFDTPLQRGGSQAAPSESIAALPTVTVTDTALVCPICTDPLLASAPARLLPCGHLYHSDCIVTWLSLRNSCPVCRGSIPIFLSTAADIASSPSPSLHPTPPGRRRSLPGTRRIRSICSRLLRRIEITRDRQTESSRDRRTDTSGDVHV